MVYTLLFMFAIYLVTCNKYHLAHCLVLDVPKVKPQVLDHLHVLSFENLRFKFKIVGNFSPIYKFTLN
ncbi:hypothetical protein BpHYR1_027472 [Brachionus plicatilis]|uniref:Secreted protein n=1 Tax=Brachionus plicatilis TaxID=10195 RepID=A0A3M7SV78_BRAPC|nr:hypothetical protein BpHYR1_027472 [Brachionus plicatilis]